MNLCTNLTLLYFHAFVTRLWGTGFSRILDGAQNDPSLDPRPTSSQANTDLAPIWRRAPRISGTLQWRNSKKNKVNGKQTRENVSFTCNMAFGFCLKMTDLEHVWLQPPQVIIFPMLFDQFLPAPSAAKKVLIKDEDATTQSSTRPERLSRPCHSMWVGWDHHQ